MILSDEKKLLNEYMVAAAIRGKVNTLGRKTFIFILFLRVDILAQHRYICILTIFFCASLDNKIFVGGGGAAQFSIPIGDNKQIIFSC